MDHPAQRAFRPVRSLGTGRPEVLASFVCLIGLALMISCGGSGSGGGKGGPQNVVGNWTANFSPGLGNTTNLYGAIDSSGLAAFFDTSGNIVQMPSITGTKTFSGNLNAYAVNGSFFSGGAVQLTDAAQGTVNGVAITGTYTANPSGTFSLAPFSPFGGSPATLSGTLNGNDIGFSDTVSLTFSNGNFTGVDDANPTTACAVNGTLRQQGTSNVFDITYNLGPGSCSAVALTGIAFESDQDYFNVNGGAVTTYLYLILVTSNSTQVRPGVVVVHQ